MNTKRRWLPLREPMCDEPHPTLRYLCGLNRGHDGDHTEAICLNSWPNAVPTSAEPADETANP